MAYKRPFDDEVVDDGSSKHQRQDGPIDEINLCNDSFSRQGASGKSSDIGESSIGKYELDSRQDPENSCCPVLPRKMVEDVERGVPRSSSVSHWATSSTSDEDELPEDVRQLPYYSGYISFDHLMRPGINIDDVYNLLDHPPRKRVPVGPDHQAEIPSWGTEVNGTTLDGLGSTELGGYCIMSISKTEPLPYNGEKFGDGRTDCDCLDQGSVRCVWQHIAEARDKLRRTLGEDIFMQLGFNDMGEVVADKWSEEEQQLFHEAVYANPVSSGTNFWNVLSAVFPSRTKMEIVSYYFNVFMLRKRARQNRCDSMNIDSDNDEWQGSDVDGGDGGVSDEDEDSGIESPICHDGLVFHQNGLHLHEDEHQPEDDAELSDEIREYDDNNDDGIVRKPDPNSTFEHPRKKSDDDVENDVQDGSCTSSDSGANVEASRLNPDGCQEWGHYIIDSSDAKAWDGYNSVSCSKHVDFLPTCMIEEVFRDDHFDSEGKKWRGPRNL
ncbi:uncharacterized protein LOC130801305 [Amaranthus tricolor]|uniref:uncharacterized protein LOC130801305 n=1 Tax=Amaranthus tricolor TaxID=29722 RepID=UPI00258689D0|nr:uncharacterized protein LOC130801305 [Amaranthus tricolor]